MIAMLTALASVASEPSPPECAYDREVELARDVIAFDQTEGQGWRPLYDANCFIEAAELLRAWQAKHGNAFDLTKPRERQLARTVLWHEAQMWAFGERNDVALPIFESVRRNSVGQSSKAWLLYVDGTLAFLLRDREALEVAIAELAEVPPPPGWANAVGADGRPISLPWPQNLDVLQGLERCWDQTYSVAYVCRDIPSGR